jgi:CHAT domain-containing protein
MNQALAILQSPDFVANYKKHVPDGGFGFAKENVDALIEHQRLRSIGDTYDFLENYPKAIEYYEKALAVSRNRNEIREVQSDLYAIGDAYRELKRWDRAVEYYRQVLEISRRTGVREDIAYASNSVGLALLELGRPQEALPYQKEALTIVSATGIDGQNVRSPLYSVLLHYIARTYNALGNRRLAIFYGKRAVNAIQQVRRQLRNLDPAAQRGYVQQNEKIYRRLAEWLIAAGRIAEAEQVLAMLKEEEAFSYLRRDDNVAAGLLLTATLNEEERAAVRRYQALADQITALGAELDALDAQRKSYPEGQFPQQARYDELNQHLKDATVVFQKFLEELQTIFGTQDKRVEAVTSDIQDTLQRLKARRTAVISTIVGEKRLNLIVTTARTQRAHTLDISETQVNQLVADFRQALTNPGLDPRPAGQKLYDILVKPLEADLQGLQADTLLWSLDGTLRYIPTAALWDKEHGYLAERYANAVLTLASRTKLELDGKPDRQALGVGVSQAAEGFPALPAVPNELDCIITDPANQPVAPQPVCATGVLDGKKLLDEKFTLTAFENALGRYPVVHVASHFRLNPGNDKDSFLLLGGGAQRRYTVADLRGVSLADVELLVLSACNTATPGGARANGVEIEGFGAVAQQRGAKAVLATLWAVADDSTRAWMVKFYQLYGPGHLSKAAAMRQTQLALMYGSHSPRAGNTRRGTEILSPKGTPTAPAFPTDSAAPLAHPYYWSPFILMGHWR